MPPYQSSSSTIDANKVIVNMSGTSISLYQTLQSLNTYLQTFVDKIDTTEQVMSGPLTTPELTIGSNYTSPGYSVLKIGDIFAPSNTAGFAHNACFNNTEYAMYQSHHGQTNLNAAANRELQFRKGHDIKMKLAAANQQHKFVVNVVTELAAGSTIAGAAIQSDDRLKDNETQITNALSVIRQLAPVKYDKSLLIRSLEEDATENDFERLESFREAGFIAQEIYKIPELAQYVKVGDDSTEVNRETQTWAVDYNSIFIYLTQAVKELDLIVQAQQARIEILEARN